MEHLTTLQDYWNYAATQIEANGGEPASEVERAFFYQGASAALALVASGILLGDISAEVQTQRAIAMACLSPH